jgi:spore coat protein A, manganese oxidase
MKRIIRRATAGLNWPKWGESKEESGQGLSGRRSRKFRAMAGFSTLGVGALVAANVFYAFAAPLPGGTLDPLTIPKYVTNLVIPPVMKQSAIGKGQDDEDRTDDYRIAIRQFKQQILPAGLPSTKVWGYGPESDPTPVVAPDPRSQFNYPAYTIETQSNRRVNVRWINGLVDRAGMYLPHLLSVDQTLHWANPAQDCMHGAPRTDCMGQNPAAYRGPVPMVTHVHGSHVDPDSDGAPEAWYLPAAKNIPAGYARFGQAFDDATGSNPGNRGYADFSYRNDQPATTLWYHDHTLGMTRTNVYAGPAGFWLIRGGAFDGGVDAAKNNAKAVLPGPAPKAGQGLLALNTPGNKVRNAVREIPLVIQDRSFNSDGSLFYPGNRAFFEGLLPEQLQILFAPYSDIAPIWNPETFFNVMVVNGVSWPKLDVAQASYRFRVLNGSNSRFMNLAMFVVMPNDELGEEIPFYQIGADQGFLPQVVRIKTGEQIALTSDQSEPLAKPNPENQRALLIAPAERVDVIVDFSQLPNGTVVRMINTAPDSPFGGFPADPADPKTTGQVMQFVVTQALTGAVGSTDGITTQPSNLKLNVEGKYGAPVVTRMVSLNEESSVNACVPVDANEEFVLDDNGNLVQTPCDADGAGAFGPSAAKLGTVNGSGESAIGVPLQWTDETGVSQPVKVTKKSKATMTVNVTEGPKLGDVEEWQIYNYTADAHPIHLHPVRFEVVSRTLLDGTTPSQHGDLPAGEAGLKDTSISYPGEITTIRIKFDLPGLYAWHCHIVEHEDNEMMRPFVVMEDPSVPHHDDDRDRHDHHKHKKHHYRWADQHMVK